MSTTALLFGGFILGAAAPHAAHATDFVVTDATEFQTALQAIALDPNNDHTITIDGDVDLAGFSTPVTSAGAITIIGGSGALTGSGGLQKQGGGALTIAGGGNTYSGETRIQNGGLSVQDGGAIGDQSAVVIDPGGMLALTNANETIGSLAGAGNVELNGRVLTIGGTDASTTYSGVISGGLISKDGVGNWTLSGRADAVAINAGTVTLSGGDAILDSGGVDIGGGSTLVLANSETMSYLYGSEIDLGANTLTIQDSGNPGFGMIVATVSGVGGRLVLQAPTTTILAGANTYTGGTVVENGAVSVQNSGSFGTGGVETNNVSLTYSNGVTIGNAINATGDLELVVQAGAAQQAGAISGDAMLAKRGAGTLTLSGSNDAHSGQTLIAMGAVVATGGHALGDASAVEVGGVSTSLLIQDDETIGSLSGSQFATIDLGANTLTTGGAATLASDTTIYQGVITGTGGVTKVGIGNFELAGQNTYTGATNINAGTLTVENGNGIADSGAVHVASGAAFAVGSLSSHAADYSDETIGSLSGTGNVILRGSLTVGDTSNTTFSGVISGLGSLTKMGAGVLALTGANTYGGGTAISAGTVRAGLGGVGAGSLTIAAGAAFELDSAANGSFAPTVSASPASTFTQRGVGRITYTSGAFGDFAVNAGVANINGPIVVSGANGLRVAQGATINGNGTINGDVVNAGVLAPGNSIGTLSIVGDYVHEAGAKLIIEFDANSNDFLSVTGDITLRGGAVEFVSLGGADGASFQFMEAGGTLSGAFGQVITPGGGAITVARDANSAGALGLDGGSTAVAGAVFAGIVKRITGASAPLSTNASAMAGAPLVLTARPSTPNAQATMLRRATNGFLDVLFHEVQREDASVWGRGFNDAFTRAGAGDSRGFDYKANGVINGLHRTTNSGFVSGFAFGFASDEAVLEAGAGQSSGEATLGAAYIGWRGERNFAAAGLALSTQAIDAQRVVQEANAGLAGLEAETGGASVALFASFGRRFDIFDWSVVASSELAYVGTRTDAYEEAGVSELRLAFDAYETQSLLAGVRLLGEHTMHLGGRSLRTRLGGGFSHDVALDDRQVNVVFRSTGDRASLDGDDSSRVAVYGLAGVTLDLNHSLALSGDVLLADGDDEPSSVNVGARWRF